MRSGVADQPERKPIPPPLPRPHGNLLDIFRPGEKLRAIFRQVAWLLTACNLPSQLRTLWRVIAREMTAPAFHRPSGRVRPKAPVRFDLLGI